MKRFRRRILPITHWATLDEIADYGVSQLFGEIGFEVALENNLLEDLSHLDTTSLSVHGEYKDSGEGEVIELTYGHSKDHRPDLKQAVMLLVVNGSSGVPLFMEPLDGNSSDKTSFHETIKKVEAFKKQIQIEKDFKWVADSALYTKGKLLKQNEYLWLTRVPETIKEAKEVVLESDSEIDWKVLENGYKIANFRSDYGGIEQRWLLVYSEQAYQREKKTLDKQLKSKDAKVKNTLWHLGNQVFQCEKDALKALSNLQTDISRALVKKF